MSHQHPTLSCLLSIFTISTWNGESLAAILFVFYEGVGWKSGLGLDCDVGDQEKARQVSWQQASKTLKLIHLPSYFSEPQVLWIVCADSQVPSLLSWPADPEIYSYTGIFQSMWSSYLSMLNVPTSISSRVNSNQMTTVHSLCSVLPPSTSKLKSLDIPIVKGLTPATKWQSWLCAIQ